MASPPVLFFQFASKLFSASLVSASVSEIVCLVINHLLNQQQGSKLRLAQEAGKVLTVSVAPVELIFRVSEQGYFQRVTSTGNAPVSADTQITMQWADLIGSVRNPNSMARKAGIQGDMDFAQTVSAVVNDLSWDPERDLARVVGDAQAVWIMRGLSAVGTDIQDVAQRFRNNLREYVVYEKSMTPTPSEFEAFRGDINQLRDDLARLEKRLGKLDSKPGVSS